MAKDCDLIKLKAPKRPSNSKYIFYTYPYTYYFCTISADLKTIGAKISKKDPSDLLENKNPICLLNELRSGLKYNVLDQFGPSHAPIFKVGIEVDGQTYYGIGGSKKVAKCRAAEEALKSFIQLPNNSMKMCTNGPPKNTTIDFTMDSFDDNNKNNIVKKGDNIVKPPVMLLNELYTNATYEYKEDQNCAFSRFQVIITVNGEKFIGNGSSKKLARNAAATSALAKLNFRITDKVSAVCRASQERADFIGR